MKTVLLTKTSAARFKSQTKFWDFRNLIRGSGSTRWQGALSHKLNQSTPLQAQLPHFRRSLKYVNSALAGLTKHRKENTAIIPSSVFRRVV
jgi:hypothetical protein